ncbi:MAG: Lipoprotein releasing system transrane protein LolC [Bacteroidota bacterium]
MTLPRRGGRTVEASRVPLRESPPLRGGLDGASLLTMNINTNIARTYLFSNKKLTAVAAFGVLLGMSIYIFMNCMLVSFNRIGNEGIFKVTSHLRVYNDDVISQNLVADDKSKYLISNPKVVPKNNTIIDPKGIEALILAQKEVTVVTPQVNTSVFYKQ